MLSRKGGVCAMIQGIGLVVKPIEIIIVWNYPWGTCQDLFSCLPKVANASDFVFEYCNFNMF